MDYGSSSPKGSPERDVSEMSCAHSKRQFSFQLGNNCLITILATSTEDNVRNMWFRVGKRDRRNSMNKTEQQHYNIIHVDLRLNKPNIRQLIRQNQAVAWEIISRMLAD